MDGNTLVLSSALILREDAISAEKLGPGCRQPGKWAEILGISETSMGCKARILGISVAESKCADAKTLAGPRMAAEGLTVVLPIARCAQGFRSRGTPPLEPGSS